jgi:SAM-dependent methyltransferase
VRDARIESRRLATDTAIVSAVLEGSPRSVLDVGCGEGWLARALAEHGVDVVGVEASAPLVAAARAGGGGRFLLRSYAEIAADPASLGTGFDAAVFNFALLEEEAAPVLDAVRRLLAPGGALYVQTVHPWTACGDAAYRDGWRTETFAGFGAAFPEAMPWYFRTLASWGSLRRRRGNPEREVREPAHPETGRPLSLLLVGEPLA